MQVNIRLDVEGNCQDCSVDNLTEWSKPSDFPIINQEFSGARNTYVYAATSSGSRRALPHFPFDTVVKMNTATKSTHTWSTGRRRFIGEPIFIPKAGAEAGAGAGAEDDGFLLVVEVSSIKINLIIIVLCVFILISIDIDFFPFFFWDYFTVCSVYTKMLFCCFGL